MPKSSEQMKNRYALKLFSENVTKQNRNRPNNFFLQSLIMAFKINTLGYQGILYTFYLAQFVSVPFYFPKS
jgi:hypothetical protein